MGLYKPRTQYGVHSATFINRTSKVPYGTIKVLSGYSPDFTRESAELYGGSNPNSVDSEDGIINNSLTLTLREFKPWLFELAGYSVSGYTNGTGYTVEADGWIGSGSDATTGEGIVTNEKGTSIVDGTNGIEDDATGAILTTDKEVDLKDGKYFLVATGPAALDVYCATDVNFDNGEDITFSDDFLKIASVATVAVGANVIADIGISLTGVGSPAFVTGDVASFEVRSVNLGFSDYTLDGNPTPIEFGLYLASQKKSNGEFSLDYYPRVKFNSVPAGMTTQEWLEAELAVKVLFDNSAQYSVRRRDIIKSLA